MAGPALPVNVDGTYPDDGTDASVKLHQQHHDTIHGIVNRFDTSIGTAAPADGQIPKATGGLLTWQAPPINANILQPAPQVGEFVGRWTQNNNQGGMLSDGFVQFLPFPLLGGTYDAARFRINTAGSAGALVRIGVYADSGGVIGSLVAQTAAINATVAGASVSLLSTPVVVPPEGQMYWVGAVAQGGATTRPIIQFAQAFMPQPLVVSVALADDWYSNPMGIQVTGVTGVFPTSVVSQNRSDYNTAGAKVYFRRSA